MGIKERRTKILLGLMIFSDIDFSPVEFNSLIQNALDLTLNQKTKGTLNSLVKDGSIKKDVEMTPNIPVYSLTYKGYSELSLQFPFFRYLKEKWDGKWRILSYEIPEKKRDLRDRLRREVAGWGLGPWHRSFWVTPHPIIAHLKELVSQREEEQYIQAFEADHVFGNREILIQKVWETGNLDKNYRELFKRWHSILSSEADKTSKLKEVVSSYVNILRTDPGLPAELVGQNWIGLEAFNIFKEIRSILLS